MTHNTHISFDPRTNDTDADGDVLIIISKTTPAHGTLQILSNGTQLKYTPTTAYTGSDSFTYTISDSHSHTSTATVSMTVN